MLIDCLEMLTKDMSSFSIGVSINSIFQASLTFLGWLVDFQICGHAV